MKERYRGINEDEIDKVVDYRIERAIEQLEEHVPPTLAHYKNFLESELAWIEQEKNLRKTLLTPLPG